MTISAPLVCGGNVVDRELAGVVGTTALSNVEGALGRLTYRGYDIADLATHATFEEVCYLLLCGALPNRHQLADLGVRLAANRALPPPILGWLAEMPADARPTGVLRTAICALATVTPQPADGGSHPSNLRAAIGLIAKIPTIVAAWHRIRRGLSAIEPLPHLSTAANFLYMRTGKMPIPEAERALDAYFVLVADHSYDASTFAARLTASTGADMYAGITSAIATLDGDRHGGIAGRVMTMLREIADPAAAEAYVRASIARRERIVGMGHRAYRVRDPRAAELATVAQGLAHAGAMPAYAIARALEAAATTVLEEVTGRRFFANVALYTAPVLSGLGIAAEEFTYLFVCGRVAGWTAHILEQLGDDRPVRPRATYTGPAATPWLALAQRGAADASREN